MLIHIDFFCLFVDCRQKKEKHNVKAPILTNTTLTVLRQIGKYLQMSRLMRFIAYNIIMRMNELFDFYLYAVHAFFTSDLVTKKMCLHNHRFTCYFFSDNNERFVVFEGADVNIKKNTR